MSDPSPLSGQALAAVAKAQTTTELEAIEMEYLGRKSGKLSSLLSGIGKLEPAERARLGQAANEAKKAIEPALATRRAELEGARLAAPTVEIRRTRRPFRISARSKAWRSTRP